MSPITVISLIAFVLVLCAVMVPSDAPKWADKPVTRRRP